MKNCIPNENQREIINKTIKECMNSGYKFIYNPPENLLSGTDLVGKETFEIEVYPTGDFDDVCLVQIHYDHYNITMYQNEASIKFDRWYDKDGTIQKHRSRRFNSTERMGWTVDMQKEFVDYFEAIINTKGDDHV